MTDNRVQARFCKNCGKTLTRTNVDPMSDLIGLDGVKAVVARLGLAMQNSRNETGLIFSDRLHTILIGNSGTGKTRLVHALATIYHQHGVTKSPTPIIHDAVDFADFSKNFQDNYRLARGHILCIENVQKLIPAGYSDRVEAMDRLIVEMSKPLNRVDPIVILSGQTQGFREFIDANDAIRGTFPIVFKLPDFTAAELSRLTVVELARAGFGVSNSAENKLTDVFKLALKNSRTPGSEPGLRNGWAATAMSEKLKLNYFSSTQDRRSALNEIGCNEILDPVEVEKSIEDILLDLDQFVGMTGIKAAIRGLVNQVRIQQRQVTSGVSKGAPIALHLVLTGNPGTGKTSVARVLGQTLRAAGVLEIGHVIEVDRGKLVAQHVGGTAPLVHNFCDRAQGGILFIDEAYTLKQSDSDVYGQEAIDTLLKRMEDDRGKFVVIVAGYPNEIRKLLNSNPGLQSRLSEKYRFNLEDYNPEELLEIFVRIVKGRGYQLDVLAKEVARKHFGNRCAQKDKNFGNAREARTLFEECLALQAQRLASSTDADLGDEKLMEIKNDDLPSTARGGNELNRITADLDQMIGLEAVKSEVRSLIAYLKVEKLRADRGAAQTKLNLHFVFRGGPGTGKTTVARLLAGVFHGLGLFPTANLVEASRSSLVGQYQGHTSVKVDDAVDRALGGVLFVDEAYSLCGDSYGDEAITALLQRMENDKGKFVVIAAGYHAEMEQFLNSNSGLRSRFTKFIDFDDYCPRELMEIYLGMMRQKGMLMEQPAIEAAARLIDTVHSARDQTFANARVARNIFEETLKRQSARLLSLMSNESADSIDLATLNGVTVDDIPQFGAR